MSVHDEITGDDLLLYHYDDGLDAADRVRIATALNGQPELAARLQALVARLDAAAAITDVPVPLQTQQRWHAALEHAIATETQSTPDSSLLHRWRWRAVAAATIVAVAIAFRLGMQIGAVDRTQPMLATNASSRCECGLKWHLAAVERQLAGLSASSGEERIALIDAVIAQNRIYAIAAARGGDRRLAGALRSFTPILERLARNDSVNDEPGAEMAQLNFELQVIQARLAAEAGTAPASSVTL
jgi:hypothetical protein